MKKFICLVLAAVIIIVGLYACTGKDNTSTAESADTSGIASSEALDNSDNNSSVLDNEKNDELEKEIDRLEILLQTAENEKESLSNQINELEEQIEDLKYQIKRYKYDHFPSDIYVKDGVYMSLHKEELNEVLSIKYSDDSIVDIVKLGYISTIKISPDRSKVILNNFEFEVNAQVFLYDVDNKKTKELLMPNLPQYYTPSRMSWLDNRYFLFVVQYDAGTIVRGGDVYIYDTQTDNYRKIIGRDHYLFQICDIDVYKDDFCVFTSILYEETLNEYETFFNILTFDEIYELINKGTTINFSN
ncbi:MAG: hypothetical protein A2Y17_07475 [Clostridiales bacterium GWF2_38_85]|nr:MAG: hypothetical protein A2Y17_07475 [Clostridiales bacterium GWF2_38_85]HBL84286.1 hypothetical protein [Clostridiales bacterium]